MPWRLTVTYKSAQRPARANLTLEGIQFVSWGQESPTLCGFKRKSDKMEKRKIIKETPRSSVSPNMRKTCGLFEKSGAWPCRLEGAGGQEMGAMRPEQEPHPRKWGPERLAADVGKTGCISSPTAQRQDAPWGGDQDLEHFPSHAERYHQSWVDSKDSRTLNNFISNISRVPTCHLKPVI